MKKFIGYVVCYCCVFSIISGAGVVLAGEKFNKNNNLIQDVTELLHHSLTEQGVEGKLNIVINGSENGALGNKNFTYNEVTINDLNINNKKRSFNARLAFSQHEKTKFYNITGFYDRLVRVPVLAQKLPRDAVIRDTDIAWIEIPQTQVKFDTVTDEQKLIGQSLKRAIGDATALKENDLKKTNIMTRNATINIVFETATLSLKTIGVALDSGAQGDVIRVRNSSSNKIVQAIIQDEQTAAAISQNTEKTAKIEDNNYVR